LWPPPRDSGTSVGEQLGLNPPLLPPGLLQATLTGFKRSIHAANNASIAHTQVDLFPPAPAPDHSNDGPAAGGLAVVGFSRFVALTLPAFSAEFPVGELGSARPRRCVFIRLAHVRIISLARLIVFIFSLSPELGTSHPGGWAASPGASLVAPPRDPG